MLRRAGLVVVMAAVGCVPAGPEVASQAVEGEPPPQRELLQKLSIQDLQLQREPQRVARLPKRIAEMDGETDVTSPKYVDGDEDYLQDAVKASLNGQGWPGWEFGW